MKVDIKRDFLVMVKTKRYFCCKEPIMLLKSFSILFLLFTSQLFADKVFDSYFPTTVKELPPLDSSITSGGKIRRTIAPLSTSTKEKPNKVKIVFFGQSITRQNYARKNYRNKTQEQIPLCSIRGSQHSYRRLYC